MAVFGNPWFRLTLFVTYLHLFTVFISSQKVSFKTIQGGTSSTVVIGQDVQIQCVPTNINTVGSTVEVLFEDKTILSVFSGSVISPDGHYSLDRLVLFDGSSSVITFSINSVSARDGGRYQCRVITSGSEYESEIFDINVLQFPDIECVAPDSKKAKLKTDELTTDIDVPTTFSCQVVSETEHVPVILTWSRSDEKTLSQSGFLEQSHVYLETSIEENGIVFTCVASNTKYQGLISTCSITVFIDENFKNNNYTNPEGKSVGTSVGVIAAVSVTVVILLIILIIAAALLLFRMTKQERDDNMTESRSREIKMNTIDNDFNANDINTVQTTAPPRPPARPPKTFAVQKTAPVDHVNEAFSLSESTDSDNNNTNVRANNLTNSSTIDSHPLYSAVPREDEHELSADPPVSQSNNDIPDRQSMLAMALKNALANRDTDTDEQNAPITKKMPLLPPVSKKPKGVGGLQNNLDGHLNPPTTYMKQNEPDGTTSYVEHTRV